MTVLIYGDGGFHIFSRKRILTLPVVGAVSTFWNVNINSSGLSPTTSATLGLPATGFPVSTNTVMSASGSNFTRDQSSVGASPTNRHTESLRINWPRSGYTYRNEGLNVATQSTPPGTTSYSEFVNLNLRGMGLNAVVVNKLSTTPTGTPGFTFSVNK
ncbi:MAG: hypothetical protein IPG93_19250 [Burkholderiales bacterium]|nr:hypothetical protein [Burkholderiales bacterium]